jgi:hypothetical protein
MMVPSPKLIRQRKLDLLKKRIHLKNKADLLRVTTLIIGVIYTRLADQSTEGYLFSRLF